MLDEKIKELAQKIKDSIDPKVTVSTAESCTGGMVSSYLTGTPGSSGYFVGGVVSYSNEVKMQLLSVKKETLEKLGAVSEETAKEMALGCKNLMQSDIAAAITGIAGPDGGTQEKPVGMVCFAIAERTGVKVLTHNFNGNREEIRRKACFVALELIIQSLS